MSVQNCPTVQLFAGFFSILGFVDCAGAQTYTTTVVARSLMRPHGIVYEPGGTLAFTELPEPGRTGGANTVSRLDLAAARKTVLVAGEPAPTHITVDAAGTLFWTCATAGVIQRLAGSQQSTFVSGLARPTGIAIGTNGALYFTQIPTPGVNGMNGGRNKVSSFANAVVTDLTTGEPEPTDVTVDGAGNLYWTCKSAGVILTRSATTGMVGLVLDGLQQPSGIAMDAAGNLYFTELPTPGVPGTMGGRNRIWKYDPGTQNLNLINFGDPEPTDVTVTPDGSRVYWTCTSAGVIVRADRNGVNVPVTANAAPAIGTVVPLLLRAPMQGGKPYLAATSNDLGPIPIGSRHLALGFDGLFVASITGAAPAVFVGYLGMLDPAGAASAALVLPDVAALRGLRLNTAFLVLDGQAPSGVAAISETLRLVVQ